MKALFKTLDKTLRKYNPVNYAKLQAPLPGFKIDEILEKLGIDDADLKSVFQWKNGVDMSRGLGNRDQIFHFGVLKPLERVLDSANNFPNEDPDLIEIIVDIGGDALLFNRNKDSHYGMIFLESTSLLCFAEPYYDSLRSMIETTCKAYECGAFTYDTEKGYLEQDVDEYWKIAAELNPNADYWRREGFF
jgi:hypothetical protein